jgi:BirA family transcriptional regulator, biotin operon repressor / biotin---[acetyl-CoA-carboxylase] ligase
MRPRLRPAALKSLLKPFRLFYCATVGSTNTRAAMLRRRRRLFAPAVVLTSRQTSGRGRGHNVWHSPPGVLTVTFVVPTHDRIEPQHVPLFAGVSIHRALESMGVVVGLKWPNDLWHDGRKLAGLLCERVDGVDLIGIGMNVSVDLHRLPKSLSTRVTSLDRITATSVDINRALVALAGHLSNDFLTNPPTLQQVLNRHDQHDILQGRRIRVTQSDRTYDGLCRGLDRHGRLVLQDGAETRRIVSGSVSLANI